MSQISPMSPTKLMNQTKRIIRGLLSLILPAFLFIAVPVHARAASAPVSPLKGFVKSADDKPLEGVAVSARAENQTFTTSVYTTRDGSYFFPALENGEYQIWAQAVGFESGRASAKLSSGKAVEHDFTLKVMEDFSKQLSGVEWMASLPKNTPEDRRAKRIIGVDCVQCHAFGFVLQNRFDLTGWTAILNFMERGNDRAVTRPDNQRNPYIHGYKEEIAAYLAKVRGPDSVLSYKPLPRVTGEANQIVVTEFDIPPGHLPDYLVADNGTDWSKGTPSRHESAAAHDAVVDHEGFVWFGDNSTPDRTLGSLDPRTGKVTGYTLMSHLNTPVGAHDMFVASDDRIWFSNGVDGTLDDFNKSTGKFEHHARPEDGSIPPGVGRLIGEDSHGIMWEGMQGHALSKFDPDFKIQYTAPDPAQPGGVMKLDPKTGKYTFYKTPTPVLVIYGVGVDANDNIWFTEPGPDRLGFLDTQTGEISEINISAPDPDRTELDKQLAAKFEPIDQYGPPWQKGPRRQASDRKNGWQWIVLSKSGAVAKVDIHTRKVTEYPLPYPFSFPYSAAVDKDQMVWITTVNTDRIFKFNPFTEKWTEYPLPTLGTDSRTISIDDRQDPFTVWVPYWQSSKIARIQFRTGSALAMAAK